MSDAVSFAILDAVEGEHNHPHPFGSLRLGLTPVPGFEAPAGATVLRRDYPKLSKMYPTAASTTWAASYSHGQNLGVLDIGCGSVWMGNIHAFIASRGGSSISYSVNGGLSYGTLSLTGEQLMDMAASDTEIVVLCRQWGSDFSIYRSTNATSWTKKTIAISNNGVSDLLLSLTWFKGKWFVGSNEGRVLSSEDLDTWTEVAFPPPPATVPSRAYSSVPEEDYGGYYAPTGSNNDYGLGAPVTATATNNGPARNINFCTDGNNLYLWGTKQYSMSYTAIGESSGLTYNRTGTFPRDILFRLSDDGVTWDDVASPLSYQFSSNNKLVSASGVYCVNGALYVVYGGLIQRCEDDQNWLRVFSGGSTIHSMASADDVVIFISASNYSGGLSTVHRSIDNGLTFESVAALNGNSAHSPPNPQWLNISFSEENGRWQLLGRTHARASDAKTLTVPAATSPVAGFQYFMRLK